MLTCHRPHSVIWSLLPWLQQSRTEGFRSRLKRCKLNSWIRPMTSRLFDVGDTHSGWGAGGGGVGGGSLNSPVDTDHPPSRCQMFHSRLQSGLIFTAAPSMHLWCPPPNPPAGLQPNPWCSSDEVRRSFCSRVSAGSAEQQKLKSPNCFFHLQLLQSRFHLLTFEPV